MSYKPSKRQQDTYAEQQLAQYLDYSFYGKILEKYDEISWQRIKDRQEQLQGIDGYLTVSGTKYVIDEKAALHYINENIHTFAFEVDSIQRGRLVDGWFINDSAKTTHYLLVWPNATTTDLQQIRYNHFFRTLCFLLPKKSIVDHLNKNGLTKEKLKSDALNFRKKQCAGKIETVESKAAGGYYYLSNDLNERPMNIVINRSVLDNLSVITFRTAFLRG